MKEPTEQLKKWTDKFGKEYTDRNTLDCAGVDKLYQDNYGITRRELNREFLQGIDRSARILEVGSNTGNQLICLSEAGFETLYGIEPQEYAVELSKQRTRGINIIRGNAFDLPFKDNYFDLVFTSGVLIHISPEKIKDALKEIVRCSRKWIWGFEYYAPKHTEINYRGNNDLLWKADFSRIYCENFPELKKIRSKMLPYLDTPENKDEMFLLEK